MLYWALYFQGRISVRACENAWKRVPFVVRFTSYCERRKRFEVTNVEMYGRGWIGCLGDSWHPIFSERRCSVVLQYTGSNKLPILVLWKNKFDGRMLGSVVGVQLTSNFGETVSRFKLPYVYGRISLRAGPLSSHA